MLGLKNSEVFLFTSKIKADCMQGGDQTRAKWLATSNNQTLGIVGEIDWKSKTPLLQRCFLPNVSRDRRFIARDQIALYAFQSFLVEVQTNADYTRTHAAHA